MLFAIILMNWFNVSGNLMSLGAIDFGLIVDGAVIIVEATMHHLGVPGLVRQLSSEEMDVEVQQSANRMMRSAAFGQIIILIVYLPILTLAGIEGKMFRPMAQTVAFAIIGALVLSVTYVPMVSSLFLSKTTGSKKNISETIIRLIQRIYSPLILFALKNRVLILAVSFFFLATSLALFFNLGGEIHSATRRRGFRRGHAPAYREFIEPEH